MLVAVDPVGSIGAVGAIGNVAVSFPVRFWCPASVSTNHACPVMLALDLWVNNALVTFLRKFVD